MATNSLPSWRSPWTKEPGRLQSVGSQYSAWEGRKRKVKFQKEIEGEDLCSSLLGTVGGCCAFIQELAQKSGWEDDAREADEEIGSISLKFPYLWVSFSASRETVMSFCFAGKARFFSVAETCTVSPFGKLDRHLFGSFSRERVPQEGPAP